MGKGFMLRRWATLWGISAPANHNSSQAPAKHTPAKPITDRTSPPLIARQSDTIWLADTLITPNAARFRYMYQEKYGEIGKFKFELKNR